MAYFGQDTVSVVNWYNKFDYTSSNRSYHLSSPSSNFLLDEEKSRLDTGRFHYAAYNHTTSYTSSRTIFLEGNLCD